MKSIRLLIAEDREDDTLLLVRHLSKGGYDVQYTRVDNPQDFAKALTEHEWDIVVSDHGMPQFSSLEALALLRQSGSDVPFVIVSGSIGEDLAVEAMRTGAQDYILKGNLTRLIPAIERELREAALRKEKAALNMQLEQAQRLESIGRLVGGVAHDFNNVLTVIQGRAQFALRRLKDDSEAADDIQIVLETVQRASAMTKQLLAFSRPAPLEPKRLNLNEVILQLQAMLSRVLGEDVVIGLSLAPDLPSVVADPTRIEQVLMNLVINARDAMPTGGRIEIETRGVQIDHDAGQPAGGPPPGNHVMIAVRDTGIGMDETTRARIFDPFFTTKPKGQGTGLGLSTVFKFVTEMNGTIFVSSEVGRGSSFKIYLPQTPSATETSSPNRSRQGGAKRILIIEDEADVREIITEVLSLAGYSVATASGGPEALDRFGASQEPIDLLITDLVLPAMDGIRVALELRKKYPEAKLLFISGYSGRVGADSMTLPSDALFIPKPFTPDEIERKVREILGS